MRFSFSRASCSCSSFIWRNFSLAWSIFSFLSAFALGLGLPEDGLAALLHQVVQEGTYIDGAAGDEGPRPHR